MNAPGRQMNTGLAFLVDLEETNRNIGLEKRL